MSIYLAGSHSLVKSSCLRSLGVSYIYPDFSTTPLKVVTAGGMRHGVLMIMKV